ncbi:hypothetical protein JL721_4476 [Aureococcus anophagefferens]|nr:hypothetical protein JL721_4476 [Aureococcus anophagefferens]
MLAGLATLLLARAVAAVDDPSWDVHTPTNATCLGGCACPARLAACVPTAPSKDMKVFASSLASLAEHAVDIESIHVVSRKSPEVDRVIAAVNARRHRAGRRTAQFYFHYARRAFPASVAVRQLYWANGPGPKTIVECEAADGWPAGAQRGARDDADIRAIDFKAGYDYVAYHSKRRPCATGSLDDRRDGWRCFGGGCAPCSSAATTRARPGPEWWRRGSRGGVTRPCTARLPQRRPSLPLK